MKLINVLLASVLFIGIMIYTEHKRLQIKEGFAPAVWQQYFDMIRRLQQAQGMLQESKTYDQWVGYIYQNPADSATALNDFKSRVFHPSCKFKKDWAFRLPPGMNRPIPAQTAELATIAYRSFMKCVASRNAECIKKLNDARIRFMESDCGFLNQTDFSAYTRNIPTVFS
jgi:hypothetical protein